MGVVSKSSGQRLEIPERPLVDNWVGVSKVKWKWARGRYKKDEHVFPLPSAAAAAALFYCNIKATHNTHRDCSSTLTFTFTLQPAQPFFLPPDPVPADPYAPSLWTDLFRDDLASDDRVDVLCSVPAPFCEPVRPKAGVSRPADLGRWAPMMESGVPRSALVFAHPSHSTRQSLPRLPFLQEGERHGTSVLYRERIWR